MERTYLGSHTGSFRCGSTVGQSDGKVPLCCRAWVLQERDLVTRTIHFSEQLLSECQEEPNDNFSIQSKSSGIDRKTLKTQTPSIWRTLVGMPSLSESSHVE